MITLLLALALLGETDLNKRTTPGAVRDLSLQTICTTRWGIDRRKVTIGMKKRVAAAYGVKWEHRSRYEFDHLIPRSLGGADVEANLWPQLWSEAHPKDRLEVKLGKLVCAGELSLAEAQRVIRDDWRAAYKRFIK